MSAAKKRKLLDDFLEEEGIVGRIPRRTAVGDAPASFAQQRLWFLDQLHPGESVYNVPSAMRIEGDLDVARLRAVLHALAQRHEVLRTHFEVCNGEPVQSIDAAGGADLRLIETLPSGDACVSDLLREEADRAFDLSTGPLFRALLVRIDYASHVLMLTLHHSIADGWSSGILWRELGALYEGKALPELPIQYADYAVWQRQWLSGAVLEEKIRYWKEALAGMPGMLELPTDYPRPAVQRFDGTTVEATLDAALAEALRKLSRAEGSTLFMTMLAAYEVLLTRYTGQADFGIAVPVANRDRDELSGLAGFFVNTLVLRADAHGEPSFRELLARVRDRALGAYAHQELPFEKLVEELQPERALSHTPLFQVMFDLQKSAGDRSFGGLRVTPFALRQRTVKCDLALAVRESATQLTIQAGYSSALFEERTVARLLGHYTRILEEIVRDPGVDVWDIDLLTDEEVREHETWNATGRPYETDVCIHELFERQAAKTPNATALVFEGEHLTYRELNARANQLAHVLRARGIGPEVLVGICVERSFEMVVGLLGILKAGGAYVPLESSYPKDRIAYMLENSGARVVLAQAKLARELGIFAGLEVIAVDDPRGGSTENPGRTADPSNLCYVIYTSGSTGKPKGAMNVHRGVCNRLFAMQESHPLQNTDRVLLKTPYSFDVSVCELFESLLFGATLVIARPEGHRDPDYLARVISDERITSIHFVPSMLSAFLGTPLRSSDLSTLRRVILTGEAVTPELARELFRQLPDCELHNLYGPTEASVEVTGWFATSSDDTDSVPIGRPIANTQMFVLDRNFNRVPAGVPGELFIGGSMPLGRGYHGRADLTADRFLPNPFSDAPGARMYRTGDRARFRADGNIEYLGRLDFQVKVRGFRIELGEIESVLLEHDAVHNAVVVARDMGTGSRQLVAYVAGGSVPASELREHLHGKLPEYMVPPFFVFMDALPLTGNGKIDRLSLPAPEATKQVFSAPEGEAEQLLADIWRIVLKVGQIGRFDNFFDLGGHSLLVMQVLSRIREATASDIPARALFESPTISQLARHLTVGTPATNRLARRPSAGAPPLSFGQHRLWFLHQLDPASSQYDIRARLRIKGPLDIGRLDRALCTIVERHEVLRTTFVLAGDTPVQIINAPPKTIVGSEAAAAFDLERGPLFRAELTQAGAGEHVLLITMHHIVTDGWSMQIVARELAALYAGAALPELPVQYADYAVWQRQWSHLDEQLSYWKQQLAAVPILELPTTRPRPAKLSHAGARFRFDIPPETANALQELSRREGVTLFMTLLAAFKVILHRYTAQEDFAVGTPVAGRGASEAEDLIGFFVNTLVLRTDLSGAPTVRELLSRVREVALQAFAHQDVPFERLVDELQPERDLSRTPLFQVMFALQNMAEVEWSLPGLDVERETAKTDSEKFDLTLMMQEHANGIRAVVGYQTDLFDVPMIERLTRHLRRVLETMAAHPDARIDEIDLLLPEELLRVRDEWNRTAREYPRNATIPALFEEQVRRTPDRAAVVHQDRHLTFAELNRRANQLARYLRRLGAGPEVPVGIRLERSLDLIVGIVGILKAGGAYVPLDPHSPAARVNAVIEDAGIRIVLDELPSIDAEADTDFDSGVRPDNLAYVIFTSGSTGRPKGVAVTQHSVLNLEMALRDQVRTRGERRRVGVNAPVVFDGSVKQIIQILNGSTLVIVPEDVRHSAEGLLSLIEGEQLDLLDCTPSHLQVLIDHGLLRRNIETTFLVGGEKINPSLWRRLAESRSARFYNVYGPTECTVDATLTAIAAPDETPTIGRPLWNARLYVLDASMRLVPAGVRGELYVGGAGVARGYVNRSDLTAERFVPNPFGVGERLYRTGDAVRWREDGQLEYLDRIDQQVKIRGFRIELEEIEVVLRQHGEVRDAVVVARDLGTGPQLVAYVVAQCDAEALRAHVHGRLPEYMVPSFFVFMDALPLTVNGKIDRLALPTAGVTAHEFDPPETETEQMLADVWASLLKVEKVGRHDNFFDLGGHSLLAMQVLSRVRDASGAEIPARTLFESPTIAQLAVRIGSLGAPAARRPIRRRPAGVIAPLSFAQQRLFFLQQLDPQSAQYNLRILLRLRGALNVENLDRALCEIVRRHEVLRTTFTIEGQRIGACPKSILVVDDESEWQDLVTSEGQRPFDLSRGPLFRAFLMRTGDDEQALMMTMHHVVTDGWSMEIFARELAALYSGATLPELPVQYADYAVWQKEWEHLDGQLSYWKRQLAGVPILELPVNHPRPAVQTYAGKRLRFDIPSEVLGPLRELSRREGVTLFMTLLAAYNVLLHRYSGQDDFAVGTPIAGRNTRETEGLIGFFVNTLVLRSDLSGAPTVRELLGRIRETALQAYAHQDVPFEKIVDELQPERDMSRALLFQALFSLQNTQDADWSLPGLEVRREGVATHTEKFDLSLTFDEKPDTLRGAIGYPTALFDDATIECMAGHLRLLLEGMIARPDARISDLPMMADGEARQIVHDWNHTARDYPRGETVHGMFEAQARRTPDELAVICEQDRLTFAELNCRANRLARHLRRRGVTVETPVGICMERSAEMLVAILGILKAGGSYVPLDPHAPLDRRNAVIEDARIPVVVDAIPSIDGEDGADFDSGVRPGNLAYIIFTSGSTGRPKGVAIAHHSVLNLEMALRDQVRTRQRRRVGVNAPIVFDASVKQLIQLINGSTLVIVPEAVRESGKRLLSLIQSEQLDLIDCTPSHLEVLIDQGLLQTPSITTTFLIGGEKIGASLWQRLCESESASFYNVYGPTECTVDAALSAITSDTNGPVLGGPLWNATLFVLDGGMQPVPAGVRGELYIGGAGLARGYVHRPDVTADRFVPHPFSVTGGQRLYRTGDAVRWRADGRLEFLERVDQQVKIRGYRIELGEIESVLAQHPGVAQCAVLLREERLVAYVVGEDAAAESLRAHLRTSLPEYMIPSAIVALERLPLTVNGKVDRRKLLAIEVSQHAMAGTYVAPRTPLEHLLAEVFADVLGVDETGIHDNFFALGGHSILAMHLVARLASLLDVEVPLRHVFLAPTVAELSTLIVLTPTQIDRLCAAYAQLQDA